MELFNNNQNPVVQGNTFNMIQHHGPSVLDRLSGTIADGAMYNSGERFELPKCYPGTCTAILENLLDWIIAKDHEAFMRWLFGPAGAGKSSILQKIAELCAERNLLIASFFFFRTAALRNDEKRLITTIAYQLAQSIPDTQRYIETAIKRDPAFFAKSLPDQFHRLVVEPLNQAYDDVCGECHASWPRLILIDGLDECGKGEVQQQILICLMKGARKCKFPLVFLIASRPETHLVMTFNQDMFKQGCARTALDNDYRSESDVWLFLEGTFEEIKATHPLRAYLPPNWPSSKVVKELVRKSSGQFIYPATVARFISPPDSHPGECLDIVLGISALESGQENPFAQLDALYFHILSSLPNKGTSLRILALLTVPGSDPWTPERIDGFLRLRPGSAKQIINKLASVVKLNHSIVQILHASLPDFLFDKKRSQQFYIDLPKEAAYFVKFCLEHFISGTTKSVLQEAIERIAVYCLRALPTEELRESFLQLDIPAIARIEWHHETTLRKKPVTSLGDLDNILQHPLQQIIYIYLDCSRRIKFPGAGIFVSQCQQVVRQFLDSQVLLYRSTSPMLLMLLVFYSVQSEYLRVPYFNLQDAMYSPCSWVDVLLAPAWRHEFEHSVLIDDTSLRLRRLYWQQNLGWLRDLDVKKLYHQFLRKHLSGDDFAMTATRVASYIAGLSSQSTWSSITKEDRHRTSVVGWDMDVGVTTISKRDFDNSILTMKHGAYEGALRYLPHLLEKASPDRALGDILRRTMLMVPDISQLNHHTSTTITRTDNYQVVSTLSHRVWHPALDSTDFYISIKVQAEKAIASYLTRSE